MEALFSVGQKVVCVDSTSKKSNLCPPLIEGKVYIVEGIRVCYCGYPSLDVGLLKPNDMLFITCEKPKCRCIFYIPNVWHVSQYRFVPLDDDRAIDEEIRESLNLHSKV